MTPYKPLLKPLRHPILCMKIFMSVSTLTGNQPIRQRSLFSNTWNSLSITHRLITSFPDIDHKMVTTPLAAIPFQLARLFILDPKRCGREPIIPICRNHTMNKPPLTPQRNHDPTLRRNHMKLINRPNSHGHNRRRILNHPRPTLGTPNQTRGYQKRQENTFPQALHTRSCGPCFKESHHAIPRVRASSCLFCCQVNGLQVLFIRFSITWIFLFNESLKKLFSLGPIPEQDLSDPSLSPD